MQKGVCRICAYTRSKVDRENLFRVVKTPNHEIKIDPSYILQGRGAYLSKDKEVIIQAKKRHSLEKSLKIVDCQNIYDELLKLLD